MTPATELRRRLKALGVQSKDCVCRTSYSGDSSAFAIFSTFEGMRIAESIREKIEADGLHFSDVCHPKFITVFLLKDPEVTGHVN